MFGLLDTEDGLNLVNMEYHQSFEEHQHNLVLKFSYVKDMENVDPLTISGVDGGREK